MPLSVRQASSAHFTLDGILEIVCNSKASSKSYFNPAMVKKRKKRDQIKTKILEGTKSKQSIFIDTKSIFKLFNILYILSNLCKIPIKIIMVNNK